LENLETYYQTDFNSVMFTWQGTNIVTVS